MPIKSEMPIATEKESHGTIIFPTAIPIAQIDIRRTNSVVATIKTMKCGEEVKGRSTMDGARSGATKSIGVGEERVCGIRAPLKGVAG